MNYKIKNTIKRKIIISYFIDYYTKHFTNKNNYMSQCQNEMSSKAGNHYYLTVSIIAVIIFYSLSIPIMSETIFNPSPEPIILIYHTININKASCCKC